MSIKKVRFKSSYCDVRTNFDKMYEIINDYVKCKIIGMRIVNNFN